MKSLRKYLYNKFAEEDATAKQEHEAALEASKNTVGASTASTTETKVKEGIPPQRKKKLIIALVIFIIAAAILIPVLVDVLSPKRQTINNIDKIEYSSGAKQVKVTPAGGSAITLNTDGMFAEYKFNNSYTVYASSSSYPAGYSFDVRLSSSDTVELPFAPGVDASSAGSADFATFLKTTIINASLPAEGFNWFALISLILPILMFVIIMLYFSKMSKMQGGGQESIFGIGKSGATIAKSNVRFSDVAGIAEEKNELIEIVDYLKQPSKYAAMGARTPRGVMLYGPPGTGKTLLAKATAGEADVNFFQISGSQFEDMLVGVGAKRVRDLFQKARKAAPAIIFIDEIDSVASKRGKNEFGGGLADQTINQLLAEMDGFNTSTGIVVMAATNRLDVLDDAILRPGRFDRHIQVNLPDIKEREAILKIHARNKNVSKKVSLYDIARRTPGFSGAQLENVLNEATLLAVRENKNVISEAHIDEAIDRVIAGPAKKTRVISEHEKKLISYHEAGHALVGLHTPGTDVVQKITIIPRGQAAGYTMQTPAEAEIMIQKKSDLLNNIRMTLGGRAAEEVIYGKDAITTGASNDLYKVTNIVRAMVMQLGMSGVGLTQFAPSEGTVNPYQQKLYSDEMAKKIDAEVEHIIQTEYNNAKKIITKNKKELELIVETLLVLETIMKEQIDYIHKNLKLPKEVIEIKAQKAKKPLKSNKEDEKNADDAKDSSKDGVEDGKKN